MDIKKEKDMDKNLLIELIERVDDSEQKFLRQVYTILIRHLRRVQKGEEHGKSNV